MSDSQSTESSAPPSATAQWLRVLVVGVVVASGLALVLLREEVAAPVSRGVPAPSFQLPVLGSSSSVSLEQYRGKVVLLNFWATWCKPCEDEMPAMDRLYRALAPEGFEMLAVSVDEEAGPVETFRQRLGVSFPILMDPAQDVSRLYQTTGFPESLLIDARGIIVERYIGPRDWDHAPYANRIRRLMKEG